MKKQITLGLLGLGTIALGAENNTERLDYSIKPNVKGGKCTADIKGIKDSEGKKLSGFKCNFTGKDKELFEKSGLSKLKVITIYNKDTQNEILETLSKINKEETKFRFDVNYIVREELAKDSSPKSSAVVKPASNPVKPKEISVKPSPKETKIRPRITDKILGKKQGTDNDFILDIGALDTKLRCFIPARNVREILKRDGRYIYVDCHKSLGKEFLKGFSNRIEIQDASLRKEIVDFIRDFHNEHTDAYARYIDYMDVPTDEEIEKANYSEIPILVVPYPKTYKKVKHTNDSDDKKVLRILQKYQDMYSSK